MKRTFEGGSAGAAGLGLILGTIGRGAGLLAARGARFRGRGAP